MFNSALWWGIFSFLLCSAFFLLGIYGVISMSQVLAGALGLVCFIAAMCILAWMIGDAIGKSRQRTNKTETNAEVDLLKIKVASLEGKVDLLVEMVKSIILVEGGKVGKQGKGRG
jgi:hypothetical protein